MGALIFFIYHFLPGFSRFHLTGRHILIFIFSLLRAGANRFCSLFHISVYLMGPGGIALVCFHILFGIAFLFLPYIIIIIIRTCLMSLS
jgi:hypothetical protein